MKIYTMAVLYAVGMAMMLVWAVDANAGFQFGKDTYEKVDNNLIVNSLGDKPQESKHGNLGYNDYIPENAFKNNLHEQGYTQVWDSKPDRDDVVEVGYMGKKGDPRTYDTDWVLKSEYAALNAGSQHTRINANTERIDDLEGLQIKAQVRAMLYESSRMKVETYYEHTVRGGSGNEIGVAFTFNIGKTYAQKVAEYQDERFEQQARRMERIEKLLEGMN